MIGDWSFLKSRRFWALVLIGIVKALETVGVINSVIASSLIIILGGFVAIGTIDKFSKALAAIK